jgi:hypothetical protein
MSIKTRAALASASAAFALGGAMVAAFPATGATVPHCASASLRVTLVNLQGTAGSRIADLRLTNVTHGSCWTRGWSGVSYVGYGNGTQIGKAAVWDPGTVRTVTLAPGRWVDEPIRFVNVSGYPAGTCRPVAVDGLRVYVPGSTLAKFVPYRTTGCRSTSVSTIFVKPVGA